MKELICITCPKGCHVSIEQDGDDWKVSGNDCEKGRDYAIKEMTDPTRVITSTVRIHGAHVSRLPVKTASDIPKDKIKQAVKLLDDVDIEAPVKVGDVVFADILGTGVPFVATRTLARE